MSAPNDWTPLAVLHMAEVLPFDGGPVKQRLLTDDRMRTVWQALKHTSVTRERIDGLRGWQRLSTYEATSDMRPADLACAAFFAAAVVELGSKRPIVTRVQLEKQTARWRDAANLCTEIIDAEPIEEPALKTAFNLVAYYMKTTADEIERRDRPPILEKHTNNDRLRAKVRGLARETKAIYGVFRYERVAETVNVGLALQDEIDAQHVRNWLGTKGVSKSSDPN